VTYTLAAGLGVAAAGGLDLLVLRTRLLTRRAFWVAYGIVVFFQLVVNGLLTGLAIVRYDPGTILGWRIAWAPVEDLLFGFAMVLTTLSLWVSAGRRGARSRRPAARPTRPTPAAPDPPGRGS
jgi:lycopene cyclase domain-containing protein